YRAGWQPAWIPKPARMPACKQDCLPHVKVMRILLVCCTLPLLLPAADPPREWIEPATGHRVIRMSDEPGSASLYFHKNQYTSAGDKMIFTTPDGISTLDLKTRQTEPLVQRRVSHIVVGRKTRQVFYLKDGTVCATHLDTRETRAIAKASQVRSGSGLTVNADETLLA